MKTWMLGAGIASLLLSPLHAPVAVAEPTEAKMREVMQRDFRARGQAKMDRIEPDGVQRACTLSRDKPPAEVAKQLEADQFKAIPFPTGSLLGDWKSGKRIAEGGRGMQWHENPKSPSGGSCYNCHQLSAEQTSHGTLGVSLLGFGKKHGYSADAQKYAYGKIYNAKAYNLCSHMPRFGSTGTLTEQQIKDLVAYLMDPKSPVNK